MMAPIILHARQGQLSKPVDMINFSFLGNARQRSENLLSGGRIGKVTPSPQEIAYAGLETHT